MSMKNILINRNIILSDSCYRRLT